MGKDLKNTFEEFKANMFLMNKQNLSCNMKPWKISNRNSKAEKCWIHWMTLVTKEWWTSDSWTAVIRTEWQGEQRLQRQKRTSETCRLIWTSRVHCWQHVWLPSQRKGRENGAERSFKNNSCTLRIWWKTLIYTFKLHEPLSRHT